MCLFLFYVFIFYVSVFHTSFLFSFIFVASNDSEDRVTVATKKNFVDFFRIEIIHLWNFSSVSVPPWIGWPVEALWKSHESVTFNIQPFFFMKTRVFIFEPLFSSASIVRCAPVGLSYSHIGAAFTPLPSCCTTLSLFRRDREEERKKVEFKDSDSSPTYTHLFSLLWGHTLLLSVLRDFAC